MKPTVHTLLQRIVKPFLLDTTNHRHKLAIFFPFHEPEGVHSGFNRAACRRRDRVDNAKNGLASKLLIDLHPDSALSSQKCPSTRTISCAHCSHINRRWVTNQPSKC